MLGFLFVSSLVLCIGLMGYVVGKIMEERYARDEVSADDER